MIDIQSEYLGSKALSGANILHRLSLIGIAFFVVTSVITLSPVPVQAYQDGIVGRTQSGCGGTQCHGDQATATEVTLFGVQNNRIESRPGREVSVSAVVAHASQSAAGINISFEATDGGRPAVFVAGAGLQLRGTELTHASPVTVVSGSARFDFTIKSPTDPGVYTIRAAGNAVNNNRTSGGDAWTLMQPILFYVRGLRITEQSLSQAWCLNSRQTIQWTSTLVQTIHIDLLGTGSLAGDSIRIAANIASTAGTFTFEVPASLRRGTYRVRIRDITDNSVVDDSNGEIFVLGPAIGVGTLKSVSVCEGQPIELHIPLAQADLYRYIWNKDGLPIDTTTTNRFFLGTSSQSDAGTYSVTILGCDTAITANPASVVVNAPPRIISQTRDTTVCGIQSVRLRVTTTPGDHTFQWFLDDRPIEGAVGATYSLARVTSADTGRYTCVVQNQCLPADTTEPMKLRLAKTPSATIAARDTAFCPGSPFRYDPGLTGDFFTVTWLRDGTVFGRSDTLGRINIDSIGVSDGGRFVLLVRGFCSIDTITSFRLNVRRPPQVVFGAREISLSDGDTLFVTAQINGTFRSLEWRRGNRLLPRQNATSLRLAGVTIADSGLYYLDIFHDCGMTSFGPITVNVRPDATPRLKTRQGSIGWNCVAIGSRIDSAIWIRNTGLSSIGTVFLQIRGEHAADFEVQPLVVLQGLTEVRVPISFSPRAFGLRVAELTISPTGLPQQVIPLTGLGCRSTLSPRVVYFDSLPLRSFRDSTIRLCNPGSQNYLIDSIFTHGASHFQVARVPSLPAQLQDQGCIEVQVRYTNLDNQAAIGTLTLRTQSLERFDCSLVSRIGGVMSVDNSVAPRASLVSVYPSLAVNPEKVTVDIGVPGPYTLRVFDIQGVLATAPIECSEVQGIELDVSNLTAGRYIVSVWKSGAYIGNAPLVVTR